MLNATVKCTQANVMVFTAGVPLRMALMTISPTRMNLLRMLACAERPRGLRSLLFKQTSQHPSGLFMRLHPLREQIRGRLIVRFFDEREDGARRAYDGLLSGDQLGNHLRGGGNSLRVLDRRELRVVG